jgi:hypothetical protein
MFNKSGGTLARASTRYRGRTSSSSPKLDVTSWLSRPWLGMCSSCWVASAFTPLRQCGWRNQSASRLTRIGSRKGTEFQEPASKILLVVGVSGSGSGSEIWVRNFEGRLQSKGPSVGDGKFKGIVVGLQSKGPSVGGSEGKTGLEEGLGDDATIWIEGRDKGWDGKFTAKSVPT